MFKTGTLIETHALASIRVLNQPRTLNFVYSSETANPEPVIPTTFNRRNPVTGIRVSAAAGPHFSEVQYTPTTGSIYHAFQWDALDSQGRKVPTGIYPVVVTGHFAESGVIEGTNTPLNVGLETSVRVERPIGLQNNSGSPFGAGWWLEELDRLVNDPTGSVLFAGGNTGVSVFQPGFYTEVLAGTGTAGFSGDGGPAREALFNGVTDVAYDLQGNLYALDSGNVRVRKISPEGVVTTVAGTGEVGRPVDGGPATASPLDNPTAIATDRSGNLYIAEDGLDPLTPTSQPQVRIRKVDTSGTITTLVTADPADPAGRIPSIDDMEFDARTGTFVTVNRNNNQVYKVFPTGQYEVVAGNGTGGFSGDNGLAVNARLNVPSGVALGPGGEIYISDAYNHRVRVVEPYGIIRTLAGTGRLVTGYQDGLMATHTNLDLSSVSGVAVTTDGEVLVAEPGSRLIRKVTEGGLLYTVAGISKALPDAFTAGPAISQVIGSPRMLAVGPGGEVAFTGSLGPTTRVVHHIRILKPSNNGQVSYIGTVGSFTQLVRNADGTFTRTDPDGTVHRYASQGMKTGWKDASGNETTYTYTPDGLLEKIIESTGQTWRFEYSGGKLSRVTDNAGRATIFEINSTSGNVLGITDPDGARTRFGYDAFHRMTSRTTALGFKFGATYSPKGQVTKVDEPAGAILRLVPQDSLALVNDLAPGEGTSCQPAPVTRPAVIAAVYIDGRGGITRYTLSASRDILTKIDPLGRTTQYQRNQAGLVTALIRPNGSRVLSRYGSLGQLLREEDTGIPVGTGGAVRQYMYSSAWPTKPTTVVDRLGYPTTTELDAAGRPLKVTDAEGFIQQKTYYNNGLVRSETDRNGNRTEYEYDSNGNQTKITHADKSYRLMTYTPAGDVDTITDEEGRRTEMTYTAFGLLLTKKNAKGGVLTLGYDADRRVISRTDERGHTTMMWYDARDRLVKTQSPSGRIQTMEYDHEGALTMTTDAKGRKTIQEYDVAGQLKKRVQPGNVVTTYEYGSSNGCASCSSNGGSVALLTKVVDPNGNATHYSHDASGRTTGVIDAKGGQTRFTLDPEGNVLRRQDPDGLETLTVYDRVHRPMAVVDPRVGYVNRRFDGEGNVVREVNALNQVTEREFNNRGWLIRITLAADTMVASTTKFEYDKVGNLTARVTPRGNRWVFEYDSLKRLSRETDPNNRSATFEYDDDGNVTLMKDRKSQETRYEYNRENEKTAIIYHDGSRVDLEYDDTGQLTRAADARVTVERKYDELDRLKTLTIPQLSHVLEMEYDKASNQTGFSINGQKSTYDYDVLNRLIKLVHSSGVQASWEYNPISLVTKKSLPNGITARMTYDRRRLMSMVYEGSSGTQIANFAYTYTEIANILTMTDDEGLHRYEYDFQNRLTSASYPSGPFEMFRYDESSNRIQRQQGSTTEDTTYDAADQIKSTVVWAPPPPCEDPDPTKCCQDATIEIRHYQHDDNGNLTQVATSSRSQPCKPWSPPVITSFFYDARDKLTRVTLPDGRFVENEYYPDSPLRLSFTDPGGAKTSTVWDPVTQDLAQDLDAAGAVMAEYIQGTRIDDTVGMVRGGATYAYVGDHLNSIRALVDGSGAVQNRYRYEVFGSSRLAQEGVANRLRFTAREWEPSTATQYNRWRHYMPQIGRWTQRDSIGFKGGINLYRYAANNPLAFVDAWGLKQDFPEWPKDIGDARRRCEENHEWDMRVCGMEFRTCIEDLPCVGRFTRISYCSMLKNMCFQEARRRLAECFDRAKDVTNKNPDELDLDL